MVDNVITHENGYSSSPALGETEPAAFVALLKPRVMSLVVFTAAVGMLAAPGEINPILGLAAILLIALGAGASGALNMWYDRDIDAVMDRTKSRPIPAGRIEGGAALGMGLGLSLFSVIMLALLTNVTSAALLAVTIAFYAIVYTIWLKRRTAQNIVIGGAAGAFPPVIGWAVVTDSVTFESLALFAIIFVWTPPHFWALALMKRVKGDYGRAVVPMLPNVAGDQATRLQILLYSLVLAPVGLLPYWLGFAGPAYALIASGFGIVFLGLAINCYRARAGADKRLFLFSILYLFSLFAALGIEKLVMGGL